MSESTYLPILRPSRRGNYRIALKERDRELQRDDLSRAEIRGLVTAIVEDCRMESENREKVEMPTTAAMRRHMAQVRGALHEQYRKACVLLLETLENESDRLSSTDERRSFLDEEARIWRRILWGSGPRGAVVIQEIQRMRDGVELVDVGGESEEVELGQHEFLWSGSVKEFGLVFDHIYDEYVSRADALEVSKVEFFEAMSSHFKVKVHGAWKSMNSNSARTSGGRGEQKPAQKAFEQVLRRRAGERTDDDLHT